MGFRLRVTGVLLGVLMTLTMVESSRWRYIPSNPPNAFGMSGTGRCAQAEAFEFHTGDWEVVADATASGGQVLRSKRDFGSRIAVNLDFAETTAYIWVVGRCTFSDRCAVWVQSGSLFGRIPSNTLATKLPARLAGGTALSSTPIGSRVDENLRRDAIAGDTAQRVFAITSGDDLVIMAQEGVELDYVFVDDTPNATPSCTGGEQVIVNYDVYSYATAPTVDGAADSMWANANVVSFTGGGDTLTATPDLRLLWREGTPDRLCGLYTVTPANFRAQERVTGASVLVKNAFGTGGSITEPINAGFIRLLATTVPGTSDSTPPSVGAPTFTSVGPTGMTLRFSASDPESGISACRAQWDTDNDNAISGPDASSVLECGLPQGGNCVCGLTGLTDATAYEVRETAINGVSLSTNTTVGDQSTSAIPNALYISPTGTNDGVCASGAPCRTFAHVLPLLDPGETLILTDGTYTPSNTGMLQVDCAASGGNAKNGRANARITVRAQNERQAWLKGTGSGGPAFRVRNCSHWDFIGLRASAADHTAGSGAVSFNTVSNFSVKRGLFHHSNRYENNHLVLCELCTFGLFEENELYYFHRHGLELHESNNNILRRNYANSRGYVDLTGGYRSHIASGGDDSFSIYPGNDNILENNISEGSRNMGTIIAQKCLSGRRNRWFGNISRGDAGVVRLVARKIDPACGGTTTDYMPHDNEFHHTLGVDNGAMLTFDIGSSKNTLTRNTTLYSPNATGMLVSDRQGGTFGHGDLQYSYTSVNDLIVFGSSYGFRMAGNLLGSGGVLTFTITNPGAWMNAPNFSPAATDPHIIAEQVVDPQMGNCRVYLPTRSPMRGAGESGTNIGAETIYAYETGVLNTAKKLWNTADGGRFALKGVTVAGTNPTFNALTPLTNADVNTVSESLNDIHLRLGIMSPGCLPASF